MPPITREGIHEEKERFIYELNNELMGKSASNPYLSHEMERRITSFYDQKIQQVLESMMPKGKSEIFCGIEREYGVIIGFNAAIAEIKERIKQAGF